ncbi:hypothetical protein A9261_12770 [Vibrio tasmaniensis]|nr:hypothetical protein A9261_12770 [Vibrio tasmaniensis]
MFSTVIFLSVNYFGRNVMDILRNTISCLLFLSLFVIIIYPSLGMSDIGWKGIFVQKNTLGLVCGLQILLIYFTLNNINFKRKILHFSLPLLLLVGSQSKTVFVIVLSVPILLYIFSRYKFTFVLFVTSIFLVYLIIVNNGVFSNLFYELDNGMFTGRVQIWKFILNFISDNKFFGLGYGAFWGANIDVKLYYTEWFVTKVSEGHSGYFDTIVTIGLIGFFLLFINFLFIWDLLSKTSNSNSKNVALLQSLTIFVVIYNVTESAFFASTHIAWLINVFIIAFCCTNEVCSNDS